MGTVFKRVDPLMEPPLREACCLDLVYVVFYKDQFSLSAGDARVTLYLETTRAFMFNKAFPSKLASSSLLVLVPPSRSTRGPGGGEDAAPSEDTVMRLYILLATF